LNHQHGHAEISLEVLVMSVKEKNTEMLVNDDLAVIKNTAQSKPNKVPEFILGALVAVLILYNIAKGLPYQGFSALLFGYLGMIFFKRYRLTKSNQDLYIFAAFTGVVLQAMVSYFLKTW